MCDLKSVLVTGGCGFIGSNVINYLVDKYPNIFFVNIDKLDYCSSKQNISVSSNVNYKFIKGNIKNQDLILFVLQEYSVDAIMHFAAQTHVDNSFDCAEQFIHDNIIGTYSLLNAAKKYGKIKRFVHVSTDEVYGESELNSEKKPEHAMLDPTNPYSASKASAEYYVKAFYKCYKLPTVITRGNNVFGPRQYPEKLIPKFINFLKNGKKCTIHGTGENRRNFIYIDDVCTAFESILFNGKIGHVYNIGTENEYSVKEITTMLVKLIKGDDNINNHIEYVEDRPWNDLRYVIDSSKIQSIGWTEQCDFQKSLKTTVEWYLNVGDDWWK